MNKHRIINILFAVAFISLLAIHRHLYISVGWFFLLVLLYGAVIFLGSYFIQLNFFTHSYCHGDTTKKQIALTFDDGPDTIMTTRVLDILKRENAPATFFVIGQHINGNEALIKRMDDEGHIVGNHSFGHTFWFSIQALAKSKAEIVQTKKAIHDIIGKRTKLFRPPYGVTNPLIARLIRDTHVKSIGWSLRSYDTTIESPERLLDRVTKKIKNGDIVLLHDRCGQTVATLPDFIRYVRAQGYEIVALDKLLALEAYEE